MNECGMGQARIEVNGGTRISHHAAVPVPSVCEVAAAAAGATGSRRERNHSRSATTGLHSQHGTLVPASSRANIATLMHNIVTGVPRWCQIVGSDLGLVAPGTAGRGAFRAARRGSGEWHTVLSSLACVVIDAQVACMREAGSGFSLGFEIKAWVGCGRGAPDASACSASRAPGRCPCCSYRPAAERLRHATAAACSTMRTMAIVSIAFLPPRQYDVLATWSHHIVSNGLCRTACGDGCAAGRGGKATNVGTDRARCIRCSQAGRKPKPDRSATAARKPRAMIASCKPAPGSRGHTCKPSFAQHAGHARMCDPTTKPCPCR
jgi:hypothetical protein